MPVRRWRAARARHALGTRSAKFNSFWTIELDAGWSLMAVHPINRDDLPFRLVTGLVDADRFIDVDINFPAVLFPKTAPQPLQHRDCARPRPARGSLRWAIQQK